MKKIVDCSEVLDKANVVGSSSVVCSSFSGISTNHILVELLDNGIIHTVTTIQHDDGSSEIHEECHEDKEFWENLESRTPKKKLTGRGVNFGMHYFWVFMALVIILRYIRSVVIGG